MEIPDIQLNMGVCLKCLQAHPLYRSEEIRVLAYRLRAWRSNVLNSKMLCPRSVNLGKCQHLMEHGMAQTLSKTSGVSPVAGTS